jgi:hypothetical protein
MRNSAAQHGVAADSPPSHSLGPLALLARLAAERPTGGLDQRSGRSPAAACRRGTGRSVLTKHVAERVAFEGLPSHVALLRTRF